MASNIWLKMVKNQKNFLVKNRAISWMKLVQKKMENEFWIFPYTPVSPSQSSQTGSDMKQKIETEVGGLWKWRQAKHHELLSAKCPIYISDHFKK